MGERYRAMLITDQGQIFYLWTLMSAPAEPYKELTVWFVGETLGTLSDADRRVFVDFLTSMLALDPNCRVEALDLLEHRWLVK